MAFARSLLRSFVFIAALFSAATAEMSAQAPEQRPAAKNPPAKPSPTAPDSTTLQAPVSKHYPILVIAHGTEPFWGLRLGMKGPERLDRVSYPPMALEPGEITRDESGNSWLYRAKDGGTGVEIAVRLTREPCSDNMSDTKYTFRVVVEHPQIGTLAGCGQSAPDKFPEFRKKNQPLDPDESTAPPDKDKQKNSVLEPITKFAPPVAVAYIDATGKIVVSRGEVKKTVGPTGGLEPALSHDGKKLLYTRADAQSPPARTIVLFDAETGRSRDLITGNARQAFWSPDDTRVAFLKFDNGVWQVWTLPLSSPEKAAPLYANAVDALHGWVSPNTVLATDQQNAYWISDDGKAQQTVALKDIYGSAFQIMGSDTIRAHPLNSDLLLVSAFYTAAPSGAPSDSTGLTSAFFLYEIRSKRRVVLCPTDAFARSAEWSRDGLQIFFTRGVPDKTPLSTSRIFWDGSGLRRYAPGSKLVVGK